MTGPKHLFLGTQADNVADAVTKERWPIGERAPSARLTKPDIHEICGLVEFGCTQTEVAKSFGVCPSHVSRIVRGEVWKSVTQVSSESLIEFGR